MSRHWSLALLGTTIINVLVGGAIADEASAARRFQQSREFHLRAQERTGILVPMYVYPENIEKNAAYNRLIDLKRRYETVPMWVIVNPASGPGAAVDPNYTKAIDRLCGAGCVVLGYVTTSYGKRPREQVQQDIDKWLRMYQRIHGIFFDEMSIEDTDAGAVYQAALTRYAHDSGCWPTVANPGADTPRRYFATAAADVFVIHEGNAWPAEERLRGDQVGYADHPPFTRGVLLHSQTKLDAASLRMARKYVRWIYVTESLFRPGDPKAANPWANVSTHLEPLCEALSRN